MQTWLQVLTQARGGCVVHRCQNKNPIERLTSGCEWCHVPEAHMQRILKKSVSWVESCLGRRLLTFASSPKPGQRPWAGVTRDRGRWKSQNRKNVYLSPYVEEPLNSKVIKSFVPKLRSRYVFFEFWDSYVLSYGDFYKPRKARFIPVFCKRINCTSTAVGNWWQLLKKGDERLLVQQNLYTTTTINKVLHQMEQTTNM